MDPLMMVIDEIVRLREDVTKLEQDISDCEVRIDFQPQDPRYIRLCTEKELVLKNLCDIRMELCQKAIDMQGNAIYARKEADGTVDYYTDKAPAPKPSPNTYTSSGHIPSSHTGMQITPPSPSHTHQYQGMYSVGGGSNSSGSAGYPVKVEPPSSKKIAPTDLPDLPRYLQAKATLSTIMRDFTDNKVHFVGLDGHVISMAEFQSISKFTKTGEDPSKFMQGSSDTYKTGYNKKTNTFTENTLFVPLCVPYQTSSATAGSSSSVASSYNGTSVGSMRAY